MLLLLISPIPAYAFGGAPAEPIADQQQDETTSGQTEAPGGESENTSEYAAYKPQGVPERPLQQALDFFAANQSIIRNDRYITIIDFTQSSTKKRMYLIDRESRRVERYYVAHA